MMPNPTRAPLHIAIDGPVASGKSVVSAALADRLQLAYPGIFYLDTGIMYRAVALVTLQHQIPLPAQDDTSSPASALQKAAEGPCSELAESLAIQILPATINDGRQSTVLVDGHDVTWQLRSAEVNRVVSRVSSFSRVRAAMRVRQQAIAQGRPIIMAGRDIASVVLPDAQVKIWLDASLTVRVQRRAAEMQRHQPDVPIALDQLRAAIAQRDAEDSAQMQQMPDTVVIQTDGLTIAQVIDRIVEVIHVRCP